MQIYQFIKQFFNLAQVYGTWSLINWHTAVETLCYDSTCDSNNHMCNHI